MILEFPSTEALEQDPVFQLNAILWAVLPSSGGDYRPVLMESRYFLHSIGRGLQIPSTARASLAALASHGSPAPDIIIDHAEDPTLLVVECKSSSFGPESSTSDQCLKLLAGVADLRDTVGSSGSRPGYLLYATRSGHDDLLRETLIELSAKLADAALPVADSGTLTISLRDQGLWLALGPRDPAPDPLENALADPACIAVFDEGDLPIPLYIIPWDPGVEQDPDLEKFGKALLGARVLNEATAQVGRSPVPGRVTLDATMLLDSATFGASRWWRARNEVGRVESHIATMLEKALNSVSDLETTRFNGPPMVEFTIKSEDERDAVVGALSRVDEWKGLTEYEQPTLEFVPDDNE